MQRISKHLSLACEGGAVYRLLLQGVSQQQLEIQKDLLTAAYGAESRLTRLHPAAHSRIVGAVQRHQAKLGAVNASTALHLWLEALVPLTLFEFNHIQHRSGKEFMTT